MDRVAVQQDPPCERSPAARYGRCSYKLDKLLGHSIIGSKLKMQTLRANDTSHIRLAQSCGRIDQRIEHGLQIEGRAADDLEHIGGGGLLLERLPQLVEQARVLDGDDGLGGERLEQSDLALGEE